MLKLKLLIGVVLYGLLSACSQPPQPIIYSQAPVAQPVAAQPTQVVVEQSSNHDMLLGGALGYMLGRSSGGNNGGGVGQTPIVHNTTVVNNNHPVMPVPVHPSYSSRRK